MEAIESMDKPLDYEDENIINTKTGLTSPTIRSDFKQQFYMYIKAFTDGQAHRNVSAGGAAKVYEAYRQICEVGRSRRPEHVVELRNRVNSPAAAKSLHARSHDHCLGSRASLFAEDPAYGSSTSS